MKSFKSNKYLFIILITYSKLNFSKNSDVTTTRPTTTATSATDPEITSTSATGPAITSPATTSTPTAPNTTSHTPTEPATNSGKYRFQIIGEIRRYCLLTVIVSTLI